MHTARELSDQVRAARKGAWERSDPTVAIVATQKINPGDEREVRRIVAEDGYEGEEMEKMVQQVASLLVGQVVAKDDDQPVEGGGG